MQCVRSRCFLIMLLMACLSAIAVCAQFGQNQPQGPQTVYAIKAGRLIDGTGKAPIPNAMIIVQGERIEAVGPANNISIPPGAQVIDLGSDTLMPGLIDGHVHLSI